VDFNKLKKHLNLTYPKTNFFLCFYAITKACKASLKCPPVLKTQENKR